MTLPIGVREWWLTSPRQILIFYESPLQCPIIFKGLIWLFSNAFTIETVSKDDGPPLWSSSQSSWLQVRRPGFDSRHYQKKSNGSGTGSTQPREYNWGATWQKSSGSCLENREYGRRYPSRWPRGTLYPQKLAITSPTSGCRSVGIVRSRTQTMEF
jgi:hypothetical protein